MIRIEQRTGRGGFSLLEVMVIVAIVGMLSTLAVPTLRQATQSAKVMRTASDLRHFATAFSTYNLATGSYPADRFPGEIPPGMEDSLPHQWTDPTPLGGLWDWDYEVFGVKAAISIRHEQIDTQVLYAFFQLDQMMDDGSLNSGRMRLRPGGLMYVLDEDGS